MPLHGNTGSGMAGFSAGVGTLRYPSSSPTSFLQRRWASVVKRRSGQGSPGGWTSGRGVSMRAWWGISRWEGLPGRARPPVDKKRRMIPWQEAITTLLCLVSLGRPSVSQPTGSWEGVSSRMNNTRRPGDRLQRSSRRSIQTYMTPPWKFPHVQPSRIMRTCPKRYPSTSPRMTSSSPLV